jgi:hypothetical protein
MFAGISRVLMGVLFVLYTYSWAQSLLDSYQHHYFVSIILACLTFFPKTSARDVHATLPPEPESESARKRHARERERMQGDEWRGFIYCALAAIVIAIYASVESKGRVFSVFFGCAGALALFTAFIAPFGQRTASNAPKLAHGFGFNLLGVAVSIVYLYTAIAKLDGAWLEGHTIQSIGSTKRDMAPLVEWAAAFGISEKTFWSLFAAAVIPQELFMAAAYLCAVLRDQQPSKLLDVICWIAVALAIALHVGAEAMGLEIGWFSHYMLLFAATYLLPLPIVDRLAVVLTWPGRYLGARLDRWEARAPSKGLSIATVAGAAALVIAIGALVDLPGALLMAVMSALLLLALALFASARGVDPRRWGLAAASAAALMWVAIAASPVRWDYYRFRAGDLDKRGEDEAALVAYESAERYAPPGQTRLNKIERLRKKLKRE